MRDARRKAEKQAAEERLRREADERYAASCTGMEELRKQRAEDNDTEYTPEEPKKAAGPRATGQRARMC